MFRFILDLSFVGLRSYINWCISVDRLKEAGVSRLYILLSGRWLAVIPGVGFMKTLIDSYTQILLLHPVSILVNFGIVRFVEIVLVALD